MSRCEKFIVVACLILLLLGLIHLYQLQSTASGKSQHLPLQPPILPAVVEEEKLEYQEENISSLIKSKTSSTAPPTDYYSSDSTTSETYSTSTEVKSTSTQSNLVVFYNRSSTFNLQTKLSSYLGSQRLALKIWPSSSSSCPNGMSSSKSGFLGTAEVH